VHVYLFILRQKSCVVLQAVTGTTAPAKAKAAASKAKAPITKAAPKATPARKKVSVPLEDGLSLEVFNTRIVVADEEILSVPMCVQVIYICGSLVQTSFSSVVLLFPVDPSRCCLYCNLSR
jgi:hypothetical protein